MFIFDGKNFNGYINISGLSFGASVATTYGMTKVSYSLVREVELVGNAVLIGSVKYKDDNSVVYALRNCVLEDIKIPYLFVSTPMFHKESFDLGSDIISSSSGGFEDGKLVLSDFKYEKYLRRCYSYMSYGNGDTKFVNERMTPILNEAGLCIGGDEIDCITSLANIK